MTSVFVGHDWAEDHHDIHIEHSDGERLHHGRLDDGLDGVAAFHEIVAEHADSPADVLIASETDRGLFITALLSAGYHVIAVNPMSTSRYRERLSTSGAKSDEGDARTLAGVARLDGHNHRRVQPDSALADAIKHTARAHQNLIWMRQRQLNQLRSVLREFYPTALGTFPELAHRDCLATLAVAPTPALAATVTTRTIAGALRRGGRKRSIDRRAAEIRTSLRRDQLRAPEAIENAMGSHVAALIAVATEMTRQITRLETELEELLDSHPHAKIILSIPGVSTKLGARLLGEFGDAPDRFADARSPLVDVRRRHVELYARQLEGRGLAPATIALKIVVLTGYYRYCIEEQLIDHSPAVHVRRPKVSPESTRLGLDRNELGAFLVQAGLSGGNDHVLACLLGLNALRVSEACGADLHDLALANGHRTLRIVGKGNRPALIPLAPRTARAIGTAVGHRTEGPLMSRRHGSRLDRHAAGRIVRRLAKHAGITKRISPHSLRHAAITAALDAGCRLRDVQDYARHADPRQTRRYDRARGALDRNPTYIVATYVAGATGAR